MAKTLQNKVEGLVYEAIGEIADELDISVTKYPEVYWLHRGLSFKKLGINKKYEEDFKEDKKDKTSRCIPRPKIIFIGNECNEHIYEESAHFLHFLKSKLTFSKRDPQDLMGLYAIIEMFGYFGSKIGNSKRTPYLDKYPDMINEHKKCLKIIKEKNYSQIEFFTYQQGYGLGEKLFNSYISGIVSKEQIDSLMSMPLRNESEALLTFLALKNNFFKYFEKLK